MPKSRTHPEDDTIMRPWLPFLLLAVSLIAGCGKDAQSTSVTGPGSGPTADKGSDKSAAGGKIEFDSAGLTIERGKTIKYMVKAKREATKTESFYQGDITLEFDTKDAPGVKIEPATIPAGKDSIEVSITTAPDCKGGEITVIGKGQGATPGEMVLRPTVR
jgi:hypothetical protein